MINVWEQSYYLSVVEVCSDFFVEFWKMKRTKAGWGGWYDNTATSRHTREWGQSKTSSTHATLDVKGQCSTICAQPTFLQYQLQTSVYIVMCLCMGAFMCTCMCSLLCSFYQKDGKRPLSLRYGNIRWVILRVSSLLNPIWLAGVTWHMLTCSHLQDALMGL